MANVIAVIKSYRKYLNDLSIQVTVDTYRQRVCR
jgi:hypothetical protein